MGRCFFKTGKSVSIESWLAFCSIAFIATVTPGPAVLLVTTHSLQFGVARTLFTILGNLAGIFTLAAFSVAGLAAIIVYSSAVFMLVKLGGACYLIYLGVKLWRDGIQITAPKSASPASKNRLRLFFQGLLVAMTNPKAIVFTTALFPQFINPNESLLLQFAPLVLTFISFSFSMLLCWSLASHCIKYKGADLMPTALLSKTFAVTFIGMGAALAGSTHK